MHHVSSLQALKQSELYELAQKGQQEPAGEPASADPVSEVKEAKTAADLLLQPLRYELKPLPRSVILEQWLPSLQLHFIAECWTFSCLDEAEESVKGFFYYALM